MTLNDKNNPDCLSPLHCKISAMFLFIELICLFVVVF